MRSLAVVLVALVACGENRGGDDTTADASNLIDAGTPPASTYAVLVMLVDYPDRPGGIVERAGAQAVMASVEQFYSIGSYGTLSMSSTVAPVLRMPQTHAYYQGLGNPYSMHVRLLEDARQAALAVGYDSTTFDCDVVATTDLQGLAIGSGDPLRSNVIVEAFSAGLIAHEIGHTFRLEHANLWDSSTTIGSGMPAYYGDVHDTMGAWQNGGDFNAWYKRKAGWLPDSAVRVVTGSGGVYRLQALEAAPDGALVALQIRKDARTNYWVYFRQRYAASFLEMFPPLADGAVVMWGYNGPSSSLLLDMTPGSRSGNNDAIDCVLLAGSMLDDPAAGVQLSVLGTGGTVPETLDVRVVVNGVIPTNRAPIVSAGGHHVLTWPANSLGLSAAVTDDGQPSPVTLSWTWALAVEGPPGPPGSVVFSNLTGSDTTATFSAPGAYVLTLTADDGDLQGWDRVLVAVE